MNKIVIYALLLAGFFQCSTWNIQAQRTALVVPVVRFFDQNGRPLAGGKLLSFHAGTTTPLATYVDSTTGALNTNPVILDSTGSATVFLGANVYKLVLQNAAGVTQWTADNIAQGSFAATYVTSYTGAQGTTRTGAVVALTGDLNCSQVTGAVCSLPPTQTLYYQTVQAGAVSAIQEPILNFIAGIPGSVTNPTLTAAGSGYTGAPTVTFSGGTCTALPTASANLATGQVANAVVTAGGSGYTSVPTVSFSGGAGSGATATAVLTGGVVTGLTITNAGTGYTSAPAVTFTGGGGTGAAATVGYLPSGTVASFVLNTTGSGCATAPTVTFSGGGGTGATGTVSVQPTGISCVDNPANTSTDCTFTVGGGGGSGGACTITDVSSTHSVGGTYQNATNSIMFISGSLSTVGSSTGGLAISEGPSSPTDEIYANSSTATVGSGSAGFAAPILPGYFYQITNSGAVGGVQRWWEVTNCGNTTATTPNALTMNNSGAGATSGTTFDGSVGRILSYNTIQPNSCAVVASSATPGFNFATPCNTNTLTANVTSSAATGIVNGNPYTLFLVQDATGGRTFVPPSVFKGWPSDINRAANGITMCTFAAQSSNLYVQRCSWF